MSFIDDQLRADLDGIDAEIARRKAAKPYEPYAAWAYEARGAAVQRHANRAGEPLPHREGSIGAKQAENVVPLREQSGCNPHES